MSPYNLSVKMYTTACRQAASIRPVDHTRTYSFFCSSLSPLWISLGCHPPEGCHSGPYLPVRPRLSTVLRKFSDNFFSFGCYPLEGVTWGRSGVRPLVTPLFLCMLHCVRNNGSNIFVVQTNCFLLSFLASATNNGR